jgi:membrane-bound serine protease (ClpP class)
MTTVVALLLAGFILLGLETVLPGLIAGTIGLILLVIGVAVSYRELGVAGGNVTLLITALVLCAGVAVWMTYFPRSRLARRFISEGTVGEIGTHRPELLHQHGTAFTVLRPAGTAVINGQRVDVVAEGALVEPGTPVKVVAVEGLRVVVRPVNL